MRMPSYTPGFVESVNRETRRCRVRFPGTEGAEKLPEADVLYPLGDKSEHTEIRILPGDRVWLDFVNGDPRFPIILGFRPKETDNAMEWRRWHHDNIELTADTDFIVTATGGSVLIEAGTVVTIRAPAIHLEGPTTVTGHLTFEAGATGTGSLTVNGKNVGSTHTHSGVSTGGGTTGAPV